jgi:UDP-glucose 4-epimerase
MTPYMAKILITGGAGYIGSHTIHYLISKGYDPKNLVAFDNLVYGHKEFLPKGVIFVKGDLTNKEDIKSLFKRYNFSSVIHFASYAYVGESCVDPGKYFENNILGGLNLLEEMRKHETRKIIFSSSCAIFGVPHKLPITEEFPKIPINPYGETKLIFEKFLDWYERIFNIKSICLRYFNAAGAAFNIGEKHIPETHIIPLVLSATEKNPVKIFGTDYPTPNGTCIRDYIHVVDLADAHLKALEYLINKEQSWKLNIGTGKGTSLRGIIKISEEIKKSKIPYIETARRRGDPPILIADFQKAKKILGWTPTKNIKDIIADAWEWHRKN